jgi:transposase
MSFADNIISGGHALRQGKVRKPLHQAHLRTVLTKLMAFETAMKTTVRGAAVVGMDVHRQFSTVTARNAEGKITWRRRLDHGDRGQLGKILMGWPRGIPVILESSFGWEWMCEELEQAGLEPLLASSRKVAAWRDARGMAKSNRTDADLLSELGGQKDGWWQVWLAPREVRDRRECLRYRMSLVRLQTGLKNRIHAILHRHGILHDFADLFAGRGRRMLTLLANDQRDRRLRESARATLKGYLQLLDHLRRQIATVTRTIDRQLESTPEGRRLQSLPGVGRILAHTIVAEVGDFGRFRSAKHLSSYSLLAPRAFDSGEEDQEPPQGRHVGHIGRRTLKWAWIEAAHGAVRRGGRFRQMFDRYTDGGKRNRNRGYILVGHELCRTAYAISKKETEYRDDPPERPGSSKQRAASAGWDRRRQATSNQSRPGTGQPEAAMVAVE